MICLFDSSALVKLVVEEDGSASAAALWDQAEAVVASRLALPECRAALAAATRAGRLSSSSARAARATFADAWGQLRVVEVSEQVAEVAAQLADRLVLGGADAVHLASAALLGSQRVVVVTWDRRLRDAALEVGLAVAPAT